MVPFRLCGYAEWVNNQWIILKKENKTVLITFRRLGLAVSSRRAIGSLFLRRRTEKGSSFFVERLVRKRSKAVCEMTLVLPVHTIVKGLCLRY